MSDLDEVYMKEAINLAKKAAEQGDIPIGCLIVYNGTNPESRQGKLARVKGIIPNTIIGRGYNQRNVLADATAHGEMLAIREACKAFGDYRLEDCTIYVTLEPCEMCAGAIVQARLSRLVYGCPSLKSGSCGSIINILNNPQFNHQVSIECGIMESECSQILKNFFQGIRNKDV